MERNRLKIALLSVHSSPLGQPGIGDTGGMSIYIRELTQELAKQGHVVDIYSRTQDLVTPEIIELAPNARQIHIQAGERADLDKLLIYSHAPDFACKTATFSKDRNLQYDIIFSHYWISGIAGLYLQTWWQVPHMVMFHTLGAIKNSLGIGEDEPELRIEEEGLLASQCQRIIASTEQEKYLLNQYYGVPTEKTSVIPCGVNLNHFRPLDKSDARLQLGLHDEKIVLFVGRIERLKGIEKIIQALPFLNQLKPRLIIVGEDGNRQGEAQRLKRLAESLGVANSVTFSGLVAYENLPVYYNAADVCVFPSYYESFGLVPLESLACGTPVVATNVGDLQNIILQGETGYVLLNNDPKAMSLKLEAILTGNAVRMEKSLAISQSVTRFGWQNVAASLVLEFDKLIRERKAALVLK
jgi:D-inositol-3-phosphate glycosyltransferase